jgi:hypothetical protein
MVKWTKEMENFIRDNASSMTDEQIKDTINQQITSTGGKKTLTLSAVRRRRQVLGIGKLQGRGRCEVRQYERG